MRYIFHPGPASPERTVDVAGVPVQLRFALEPGYTVDAAIAKGFADAGCLGGFVTLRGGKCEPFRFVIPAASPDARHAAWYSDTFAPAGPVEIKRAGVIVGRRDGKPFIHCHGLWDTPEGTRMGHMLAPDSMVVEVIEATGIGLRTVIFEGLPDPETNFTLFQPIQVSENGDERGDTRVLLAKVRPNEDISVAIENICSRRGIETANVYGIGSLNEVHFTDGAQVKSYATEVSIDVGRVETAQGKLTASLQIDVVDMEGQVFSGKLVREDNPVCVTFELVIEEVRES